MRLVLAQHRRTCRRLRGLRAQADVTDSYPRSSWSPGLVRGTSFKAHILYLRAAGYSIALDTLFYLPLTHIIFCFLNYLGGLSYDSIFICLLLGRKPQPHFLPVHGLTNANVARLGPLRRREHISLYVC